MRSGALRQLPPLRAMASEVLARVHACSRVSEAEAFDLGSRAQVSDCWSQWEWSALVQRWNALLQIRVVVRIWRRRRRGGGVLHYLSRCLAAAMVAGKAGITTTEGAALRISCYSLCRSLGRRSL